MFVCVSEGVSADASKSADLSGYPEAVVGTGPGAHLRLTDPSWPPGRLRVERDGAVYRVTNEMTYTVRLGEADLGDGATAVWYAGVELHATEQTCLILAVAPPAGPVETGVSAVVVWAGLGVAALLAGLFLLPDEDAARGPSPGETRAAYDRLMTDMEQLRPDPAARAEVAALGEIQAARFHDVRNRPTDAYLGYLAAREVLDRAAPGDRPRDVADRARTFVTARMTALAPRVKQRR